MDKDPNAGAARIMTDPNYHHAIDISYDDQLDLARKILPKRIKEYEKLLGRPLRSVIEVGCATGAYARAFDECGIAYIGIEIEDDIAEKARERTGLNIIGGNFMDQKFDQEFDLFFCSQVLEHVPDPSAFIKHAISICGNGLLHIDVPNHDSLTANIRKIYHPTQYGFIQPAYHMMAYNKSSLNNLLNRCGLDVIDCHAVSNDDPIWGQLVARASGVDKILYFAAAAINAGSVLMAIGKPNAMNTA